MQIILLDINSTRNTRISHILNHLWSKKVEIFKNFKVLLSPTKFLFGRATQGKFYYSCLKCNQMHDHPFHQCFFMSNAIWENYRSKLSETLRAFAETSEHTDDPRLGFDTTVECLSLITGSARKTRNAYRRIEEETSNLHIIQSDPEQAKKLLTRGRPVISEMMDADEYAPRQRHK